DGLLVQLQVDDLHLDPLARLALLSHVAAPFSSADRTLTGCAPVRSRKTCVTSAGGQPRGRDRAKSVNRQRGRSWTVRLITLRGARSFRAVGGAGGAHSAGYPSRVVGTRGRTLIDQHTQASLDCRGLALRQVLDGLAVEFQVVDLLRRLPVLRV